MRFVRVLAALSLASVALAGCGEADREPGGGVEPAALDGRTFLSTTVLEGGAERSLVPGTQIQLGFAGGQISIQAGCNSMGGGYQLDGNVLWLDGALSTTEMGCDPERHEQDAWISAFLGGGPRVALDGGVLTLRGGNVVIELMDREVAEPDLPLVGTTWALETIIEGEIASSVPAGLEATLRFPDEGTVEVFTGCNTGGGWVELGDGTLAIRDLAMTLVGCGGSTGALERDVLAVLTAPMITYSIEGPTLFLRVGELGLDWRA